MIFRNAVNRDAYEGYLRFEAMDDTFGSLYISKIDALYRFAHDKHWG